MAARVTVNSSGSFRVEGEFELVDPAGNPFDVSGRPAVFLCGCGKSANRPLCDGAHKQCSLSGSAAARDLSAPPKA
jgi:CDGSH-type Zn-finger protein